MTTIPLDANGAPDLQKLVRDAGGYHLITPDMWAAVAAAMRKYQLDYIRRDLAPLPAPATGPAKKPR
jgi:hypothetical protein